MTPTLPAILVVDDDDDIRDLLTDLLESQGYTVQRAVDGVEALQCLRSDPHAFGLVLVDVMMPGMNGWQFLSAYRQDLALAHIRIIMLSAGAVVAGDAVADDVPFVKKPFDVERLLDLVAHVLSVTPSWAPHRLQ